MTELPLLPYAQGQGWTVNFEGENRVTLADTGLSFERKAPESPPQPGEWALIPSSNGKYALAWFVCVKCDDARLHIMAMVSAHDVLTTVTKSNIYSLPTVIALRHSQHCIRLSDPSPADSPPHDRPEETISAAVKLVEDADLAYHFMHSPRKPLLKQLPPSEKVLARVEMIRREMRRRKKAKFTVGGLYRLVPTDILREIALKAGLKDSTAP